MPKRRPLLAAALITSLSLPLLAAKGVQAAAASAGSSPPPAVSAAAGVLVNPSTGRHLWAREQAVQRPIASITKLMTALVVARAGDLRRRITVTQAEVNYVQTYGASNAGLRAGDILTARALLYGMLLPSGADAAMALAQSYGPGIPAFVRKMNALASKLHMSSSDFTNFDGLLDPPDLSTPTNLIKLGEAAMREPILRAVVGSQSYSLPAWPHRHHYYWKNTNLLLKRYPGAIGIKTGWTPEAGECLLFEAVHHKKVLIGVVLDSSATNSGVSFVDAANLLNWAFGLNVPVPPPTAAPLRPRFSKGG